MDLNKLLFEFSKKERYILLKGLYEEGKRHSELQKEFNIPGSEISRHLKRLKEKDLVFKDIHNYYHITNIGKIFISMMDIFEVSLNHKDFLNTHQIKTIPVNLILKLGNLKTLKIKEKTLENVEEWSNLIKKSQKFIYAISEQLQHSLLPVVEKKIKNQSMEVRALIDLNLVKSYRIPEEWSNLFEEPITFYKKLKIYDNIKILKEIELSLLVSDKGAILFLSRNGQIDYSQCLYGIDENFINWAIELFEWYWIKGNSIRPFIRKAMHLND